MFLISIANIVIMHSAMFKMQTLHLKPKCGYGDFVARLQCRYSLPFFRVGQLIYVVCVYSTIAA